MSKRSEEVLDALKTNKDAPKNVEVHVVDQGGENVRIIVKMPTVTRFNTETGAWETLIQLPLPEGQLDGG